MTSQLSGKAGTPSWKNPKPYYYVNITKDWFSFRLFWMMKLTVGRFMQPHTFIKSRYWEKTVALSIKKICECQKKQILGCLLFRFHKHLRIFFRDFYIFWIKHFLRVGERPLTALKNLIYRHPSTYKDPKKGSMKCAFYVCFFCFMMMH